ncbi:MAG TPA: D-alanyl-D-alanine carboxypeptidase/D-alanyl-D-alanine-endopeptidase [Elusimicrobia bacterium]|nr:MAG: D-alanyl-D-alanine carboxypeptidase/D-alanyl-D-alanine-endopeptidase [Elusimicrobia bacterium GWF2_62_30]HBA60900.1 D-alanyl-D-alanine carboxypeptidase/D-alanyl-D-alanine-endopeptidase [Elusimicrobiota bacterium]
MAAAKIFIFLGLCLAAGRLAAEDFAARAEAILSTGPFAGAQLSVVFASAENGAVVYARNPDLPLVPASTAKLASSAAALTRLTPDFRFNTTFLMPKAGRGRKKISALVWRGTGDPSISGRGRGSLNEIFEIWADSLAALGVTAVKSLVLDGRYFDGPAVHPTWPAEELSYWYQAETSAIAFNDNCVDLEFQPAAKAGRRPKIVLTPDFGYLKVKNKAVTGPAGSAFTLDFSRAPGTNTVTFTGSIPAGRSRKDYVSVHDPARFAAEAFWRVLRKKGVEVSKVVPWEKAALKEEDLVPAFAWSSEPLAKLVQVVNTNSQNLYAEHILKALGKEGAGSGSFAGGVGLVYNFLGLARLGAEQFRLVDGSGLSEENRFTAAGLVKILLHMQGTPLFPVYYESLAPAKDRMKGDPVLAAGMRLKRGTVGPARNLAGYLHSASGKLYAFAVLVNAEGLNRPAVDDGIDELCLAAARQFP